MPYIYPIETREWLCKDVYRKYLRPMYGPDERMRFHYLPQTNIEPEHIVKLHVMDVEFMLACLQAGAWLGSENWQTYARYAIAKRLRVRSDVLFQSPFDTVRHQFMEFQLKGGTFQVQDDLRKFVVRLLQDPNATLFHKAGCRMILSVCDDIRTNTVIQPFHWIRATLAASEANPVYGLTLYHSEMHKQKVTLCKMLRATQTEKSSAPAS